MRLVLPLLLLPVPVVAQDTLELAFPVACELGETCMIQQVMDRDPGPNARDFQCGPQSYDGHSGTDIRVPDLEALNQNVPILAAAAGVVLGTRNTVPDTGIGGFPEGQDCGNGVLIDHGDGWQTQYCHLAQGSISVATGDTVEQSQPIGSMGFSGNTEFPHLHLTLRLNGENVDPFDPSDADTCGQTAPPLWSDALTLTGGGILSIGFSEIIPDFAAIRAGTADANGLSPNSDAMVIWGFFHSARPDDVVRMRITAPDESIFHETEVTLDRTQAEVFRASGRRISADLVPGNYTGTVEMIRDGTVLDSVTAQIPVR